MCGQNSRAGLQWTGCVHDVGSTVQRLYTPPPEQQRQSVGHAPDTDAESLLQWAYSETREQRAGGTLDMLRFAAVVGGGVVPGSALLLAAWW